jgi:hypothetical protein
MFCRTEECFTRREPVRFREGGGGGGGGGEFF